MSPRLPDPAARPAQRTERDLFAWSLLGGLGVLIVLAGPFFAGQVYVLDDLGAFHLPARAFYAERLMRGEPFDWMPQLFCGFYLTGEGQAGTYHPLHWVLYKYLPLEAALGLEYLASYPLMMLGTWLWLRRRLRRRDAAMLGAVLFTFSGFNLLHFVHPNAVAIVAHVPWLLWATDVVLVDGRRQGYSARAPAATAARRDRHAVALAGIALLSGSQLLLGYPQYVWFSLVTEAGYVAWLLLPGTGAGRTGCRDSDGCRASAVRRGHRLGQLVIAKAVGALLGGVQLLPTLDALWHSGRASADAAFTTWGSLHKLNLVQLVAPYLFADRVAGANTHELGTYAGAVPLMLVVWLVVRWRRLGRLAPLAWASAALGVLSLLMALGQYGPLYRFQQLLPLVGRFRFPCRYLVLFQLAVAVAAAIGFVLLTRDYHRSRRAGRGDGRLRGGRKTTWGLSRFSRSENGTAPFRNREVICRPPLRSWKRTSCAYVKKQ